MTCIHSILCDNMADKNIRIKEEVKSELDKIGSKNQSYSDIIKMLLQSYDESITFDNVK